MEIVDMQEVLKEAGINENVIPSGLESIATGNPIWQAFTIIKKPAPPWS